MGFLEVVFAEDVVAVAFAAAEAVAHRPDGFDASEEDDTVACCWFLVG